MEKQKVYTAIVSDYFILNTDWYFSKHCSLAIFPWASVPILDFLDQLLVFSVTPLKIDQNKKSKPFDRSSQESGK